MNIIHKDATITPTGVDSDSPGTFEVILSAPTLDRDGDTLGSDEWKLPLPAKITFDSDHGMSVATTVGSGVPSINDAGELVVSGTYSSLPRAQEVRTLVNEGHINTTSVAFMTLPKTHKDAKPQRELLNGAFVAIPSNREALVLSSKSGARNSKSDAAAIQSIHDGAATLGADCSAAAKSFAAYRAKQDAKWDASILAAKTVSTKDADTEDQSDPAALAAGVDAAIDEAINLFASVDVTTLPAEVQQAIALIQAADATVDELLDALGIQDPDENAEPAAEVAAAAAAEKSAAAVAETKAADDAASEAVKAAVEELTIATFIV